MIVEEATVVIVEEAADVWARNQQRQHYHPHRIRQQTRIRPQSRTHLPSITLPLLKILHHNTNVLSSLRPCLPCLPFLISTPNRSTISSTTNNGWRRNLLARTRLSTPTTATTTRCPSTRRAIPPNRPVSSPPPSLHLRLHHPSHSYNCIRTQSRYTAPTTHTTTAITPRRNRIRSSHHRRFKETYRQTASRCSSTTRRAASNHTRLRWCR